LEGSKVYPTIKLGITMSAFEKWDCRFLELAHFVGKWSKDPSMQVGAVITNARRVISLGFNGFPAGVDDLAERYADRDIKLKMVVHAETNAIISARESLAGCTIYVSASPCAGCAGKIIQAGISRVISVAPAGSFADRWKQELDVAATMFCEARVDLIHFDEGWRERHQQLASLLPVGDACFRLEHAAE
jgi:dCMP deaminase